MNDLISRKAAIKAIEDLQDCYNGFSDSYDKACIIGVLEEVPSAQPEDKCGECDAWNQYKNYPRQQWIPCSERLPDKEDVYLCCSTAQDIWILRYLMPYYFKEGAFIQFDGDYPEEFSDVIAWMPLPEPYKAESDKESEKS